MAIKAWEKTQRTWMCLFTLGTSPIQLQQQQVIHVAEGKICSECVRRVLPYLPQQWRELVWTDSDGDQKSDLRYLRVSDPRDHLQTLQ